mmetsp:Transcript_102993/g.296582  ORF Transcript_102993/g.296582 Transcript_102993/m.296582 type:complete len:231 (-) Transcript_102993:568-1260(-)
MPASSVLISSARVATRSLVSAIIVSRSSTERSSSLCLSSAMSSCWPQYSCLCRSSACSCSNVAMSSSIIFRTLSKPILRPRRAKEMKSKRSRLMPRGMRELAFASISRACARMEAEVTCICTKLAVGLGSVFLKSSSASSSFKILIVSDRATTSWARTCFSSSWTLALESQFFSRSAATALSCSRVAAVSPRSFFMLAISTPTSATRASFVSIDCDNAATSFFLEATRPS